MALACSSTKTWQDLRTNLIGTIDPQSASKGSFRRELYDSRHTLSLEQIDIAHNYIHLSPGPLEGLFQIIRFMSNYEAKDLVPVKKTNFGLAPGLHFDENTMSILEKNPEISINNVLMPLFDYTEDMDNADAHAFLLKNFRKIISGQEYAR